LREGLSLRSDFPAWESVQEDEDPTSKRKETLVVALSMAFR